MHTCSIDHATPKQKVCDLWPWYFKSLVEVDGEQCDCGIEVDEAFTFCIKLFSGV